jgi:microcystin-dependent protein
MGLNKPTLKNINMTASGTAVQYPSWLTGINYIIGDTILYGNTVWTCLTAHTSGTFTTDWLTSGYWININDAPGTIKQWGRATANAGYLICDGSAISRTVYDTLFAVIGTTFGIGDNSTTFNLPSFGGTSPAGIGTSTKLKDNDQHNTFLVDTLGTYSSGVIHNHYHKSGTYLQFGTGGGGYGVTNATPGTGYIFEPYTDGTHGTPTTGHYTKGPTLAVNFIIKY